MKDSIGHIAWLREITVDIRPPMFLLKRRGLKIGEGAYVDKRAYIDWHYAHLITIEAGARIAPGALILAHDGSTITPLNYQRIGRVRIGRGAFVGGNAVVMPNVDIGDGSIVGAGAVVFQNIPPGMVAVGNPARVVDTIEGYRKRYAVEIHQ